MKFPDLSALEELPEKTQEMQDSLHRVESLLRMLIEIQARAHSTHATAANRLIEELAAAHGVDF